MGQFSYIAVDAGGKQIAGSIEADSESLAIRLLDGKGLFPVSVRDAGAAEAATEKKGRKVKRRDIGTMYGQLADLLGSGVPLLRALDSLIKSPASSGQKELLK